MEFFKRKTNIDFLGIRKWTAVLSLILVLGSFASLAIRGINWGLDFTGGYAIEASYNSAPNLNQIRDAIEGLGISHVEVITFGSPRDIQITVKPL